MTIEFSGTTRPSGLEIADTEEQRRLTVKTGSPVEPQLVDSDGFCFPVDEACVIETTSMVFDQRYYVSIHGEDGRSERDLEGANQYELSEGTQFVSLSGPIKLYCEIQTGGTIKAGINRIAFSFEEPTTIIVGGRSLHEQPRGTIETPADPEPMMEAVSALSTAIKTTSPERAWPTLRGHPPLIECGERLKIPDRLEETESPVEIEIPSTYRALYTVAPLAFYLGGTIRPREEQGARLITEVESYELGVGCRLEDDVARILKHLFLLDCVVRTEGIYGYAVHERNALESMLPFDLKTVYEESLSEQIERYLSVPYDVLEPHIPRWPLTAHVPSTPDGVEVLPYVLNQFGLVREPRGRRVLSQPETPAATQFVRSAETNRNPIFTPDGEDTLEVIEPDVVEESIEHAWFGSHAPKGASKATIEAYQNQLTRGPRNESIEILLICNDVRMLEEHDVLDTTYGNRESLPFEINSEFGVSTDQLAQLLTEGGYDFLHYIGHATPEGLECMDGSLDVRSLESVDVGVFFLNACQSYEQGLELVKRGAYGGIATLRDVINDQATDVGEAIAQLLNCGFPLRATLEVVKDATVIGDEYLIIGDGSTDIAQSDGGAPNIDIITNRADNRFNYEVEVYSTKALQIGSLSSPSIDDEGMRYFTPKRCHSITISEEELTQYLTLNRGPVKLNGVLNWNTEIGLNGIDLCSSD